MRLSLLQKISNVMVHFLLVLVCRKLLKTCMLWAVEHMHVTTSNRRFRPQNYILVIRLLSCNGMSRERVKKKFDLHYKNCSCSLSNHTVSHPQNYKLDTCARQKVQMLATDQKSPCCLSAPYVHAEVGKASIVFTSSCSPFQKHACNIWAHASSVMLKTWCTRFCR